MTQVRDAGARPDGAHDTTLAVRNALLLGASLVCTWAVALLVRLVLPRHLGPELFGQFNFADTIAANAFVFLGVGLDMYIQKELPARMEHASDFLLGAFVVRAALSVLIFAGAAFVVHLGGRPFAMQRLVFVFGLAQLFSVTGATFATLLYASRTVGRLAVLNVVTKLLWAGGVAVALLLGLGVTWFAVAFLVSESTRCIALYHLTRRHVTIEMRLDWPKTWRVLVLSLPFFVNAVAIALYARIDVNIMGFVLPDRETGWYSAASNISGIALLMAPLMGWVLMPQLSRAAAASHQDLFAMARRTMELLFAFSIPIALALSLGAEAIVHYVFGQAFEPATNALRVLGPLFVMVYLAMLAAQTLIMMNRSWTVTTVSVTSMLLNALLNVLFVRRLSAPLGPGGGGTVAAAISVFTEVLVCATLLGAIGRVMFDRRALVALAKSLAVVALVVALDVALRPLGPLRVLPEMVLYLGVAVAVGAIKIREMAEVVRAALRRRREGAAT